MFWVNSKSNTVFCMAKDRFVCVGMKVGEAAYQNLVTDRRELRSVDDLARWNSLVREQLQRRWNSMCDAREIAYFVLNEVRFFYGFRFHVQEFIDGVRNDDACQSSSWNTWDDDLSAWRGHGASIGDDKFRMVDFCTDHRWNTLTTKERKRETNAYGRCLRFRNKNRLVLNVPAFFGVSGNTSCFDLDRRSETFQLISMAEERSVGCSRCARYCEQWCRR